MLNTIKIKENIKKVATYITALIFTYYMNINSWLIIGFILGLCVDLLNIKTRDHLGMINDKKDVISAWCYSLLLSVSVVMGKHIHIDSTNIYAGTKDINYITSYSFVDIIAVCGIAFLIKVVVESILLLRKIYNNRLLKFNATKRISYKSVLIAMAILILLWIPYLYVYYPGFYFGDTSSNVIEALGLAPLTNHHPVMYILFIRFCLNLGLKIGGMTQGLAIFCLLQTIFMAAGISYFLNWIRFKFSINKWLYYITVICFGTSAYVAQYSIAIWKDPIFSVSVITFTICLVDAVYAENNLINVLWAYIKVVVAGFLMIFSRNNGLYIIIAVIFILLASLVYYILKKERVLNMIRVTAICIIVVLVSGYITGPVYDKWGVDKSDSKVESYGIFLNQLARVAAYNGNLTDKESLYLNGIYPIDSYDEVYTPCCVDNLKWNPLFNKASVNDDFIGKYISIAKKNIGTCIEAWELQTFGFWTVNQKCVNTFDLNVSAGVPRNVFREYPLGVEEIELKQVDDNSNLIKLFPYTARDIPVPFIHWLLIALAVFAIIRGDWRRLIMLSPALGLMMTLIIASPIWYWPRYGFAQQLLLPLLLVMCFVKKESSESE